MVGQALTRGLRSRDKSSDQIHLIFSCGFCRLVHETGPLYNGFVRTSKHLFQNIFFLEITYERLNFNLNSDAARKNVPFDVNFPTLVFFEGSTEPRILKISASLGICKFHHPAIQSYQSFGFLLWFWVRTKSFKMPPLLALWSSSSYFPPREGLLTLEKFPIGKKRAELSHTPLICIIYYDWFITMQGWLRLDEKKLIRK